MSRPGPFQVKLRALAGGQFDTVPAVRPGDPAQPPDLGRSQQAAVQGQELVSV